MSDWIPFENATYLTEQAFLLAEDKTALILEQTTITISGSKGNRRLSGTGLINNILLVELLEENDDLDLVLDFGGDFKFLLKAPELSAGKVFSPKVKSFLRFSPANPWNQIPESEFDALMNQVKFL